MHRLAGVVVVVVSALTLVPASLADTVYGDIGLVGVTPNVAHARGGGSVAFSVVEKNFGPIEAEMDVAPLTYSPNLVLTGIDCDLGTSSDGPFCEYGPQLPGTVRTSVYTFTVLPGARLATFTPCVVDEEAPGGTFVDTNSSNNCGTGAIRVIGKPR
jgi:hypothetical protein